MVVKVARAQEALSRDALRKQRRRSAKRALDSAEPAPESGDAIEEPASTMPRYLRARGAS